MSLSLGVAAIVKNVEQNTELHLHKLKGREKKYLQKLSPAHTESLLKNIILT